MRGKLLKYYKEDVSVEALVNSHIKKNYLFLILSFWLVIISLVSTLITYSILIFLKVPLPLIISVIILISSLVPLIISLNMYLIRARAVVRIDLGLPLKEKEAFGALKILITFNGK
ncbi:hypothetical protein [Paenibacillus sp. NPDC057934]|uniref:hypothetical protein n=1 Tax=Paenibacillus sp. NPDC057934 TaxID=3346282 RepID=UPI0036D8934E